MRNLFIALVAAWSVAASVQAAGPMPGAPRPPGAVVLTPGDDIQAAVDAHGAATVFFLSTGTYRAQTVRPKNGNAFIGEGTAVLDGALLLENFARDGADYAVSGLAIDKDTLVTGVCRKDHPRCDRPQDLYFDGQALRAVGKRADVGPGTWFYDYPAKTIYFADDPAGHVVELSYRPFAFGGPAGHVRIQNLVIEKYASANQQGAVNDHGEGRDWTILQNEVRWNHGYGVVGGTRNSISENNIHHNGGLGLGGGGVTRLRVGGNEIAFNSWNGVDCDWECGGAKWGNVTSLTVSGNYVHDNQGPGLWTDIDCSEVFYVDNLIERNLGPGISHEISGYARIHHNTLRGNGADSFVWGWSGQIQIQNSTNVHVNNNTLVLDPAKGGNGIMIIQQDRGARHMPRDNWIHDNDVTMAGGTGAVAGWFADYKAKLFPDADNRFDRNRYHIGDLPEGRDVFAPNEWVTFDKWQATGQDRHSTVDGEVGG